MAYARYRFGAADFCRGTPLKSPAALGSGWFRTRAEATVGGDLTDRRAFVRPGDICRALRRWYDSRSKRCRCATHLATSPSVTRPLFL